MIDVQRIVKRFGSAHAVDDISFQLKKGEILGFLGPNGAGKTTTLRIISSYLEADSGHVTVDGADIARDSLAARRKIGYMPENNPLYLELEVEEYLSFIAQARGIGRERRGKRIDEAIELCGIGPVRKKNIHELSKGFRQRVGFAQTLLHDPDYLILDEPTSGLDPNQIVKIRALIRELGRNKALIISTHILQEVEASCTRIVIIDRGKIVGEGTREELTVPNDGEAACAALIKAPEAEILKALEEIEGIREKNLSGANADGYVRLRLKYALGAAMTEAVAGLAARRGWPLAELKTESASLEDVFRRLTGGSEKA